MSSAIEKPVEPAPGGRPLGIVMSPLLNLAPCAATGPRVNQHRPILALGTDGLRGTVMLSLAPDRRTIEVRGEFGSPAAMHLRRVEPPEPYPLDGEDQEDLLVLAFHAPGPGAGRLGASGSFPLGDRRIYAPFAPTCALHEIAIPWPELRACSIEGICVEPARAPIAAANAERAYFVRRMLAEIGAAEGSRSAVAACRHVELANLYARHVRDGDRHSATPRDVRSAAAVR